MPPSDPQWFYSSFSQVTAAIVGFIGGFLVLRLQNFITVWRETRAQLLRLQRRWLALTWEIEEQERTYKGPRKVDGRYFSGADSALKRQQEDIWRELRDLSDQQLASKFPRELVVVLVFLGGMLALGVFWPLIALGEPSNAKQTMFLAPFGMLIVGAATYMSITAVEAHRAWNKQPLWSRTEYELENERLQEEAQREGWAEEAVAKATSGEQDGGS